MLNVTLKPGKEKPVLMGHPWIFAGAIARLSGKGAAGELCKVLSTKGEILGTGYYNDHSAITIRMLSSGKSFFGVPQLEARITHAVQYRKNTVDVLTDSCRLINSEGDFLPGLIVDKFSDGLVIQIGTAGMELFRNQILEILVKVCSPGFIYERSDTESRLREGLGEKEGLLYGVLPEPLIVRENDLKFLADIGSGQKTGFFFDQRNNRALLKHYSINRKVCDCFSYSGGFTVNALAGGAEGVDAVDVSKNAIDWVQQNIKLNFSGVQNVNFFNADVFKFLREIDQNKYDLIILDPPKFAKHQGEVERASRGYKDINLVALKKVASDGIIFTFSCSNAVDIKLFRQIVFAAAADSGRSVQVLHTLTAGTDHPVNIAHKEGEYLKGLVLRVI